MQAAKNAVGHTYKVKAVPKAADDSAKQDDDADHNLEPHQVCNAGDTYTCEHRQATAAIGTVEPAPVSKPTKVPSLLPTMTWPFAKAGDD